MKTLSGVVGILILLVSSVSTFAIEGLKVSVQSTNAVLAWPSMTNETFLAQYRQTLNATDSWLTLTNYFPAATNAATTTFSNSVAGATGFYRVVPDGVQIYGLTNGMVLSGTVQFPVEMAVDSTDEIVGVSFYDENTNPIIGAYAQSSGSNVWRMVWNTPLSFNGNYNIYAELDFASNDPVVSSPVTVTVNNTISFPNYFSQVFGNQMWIYAQTVPDASYEIDIFDESSNYVGSFYDSADDSGVISFLWNLVDGDGVLHDDTNFLGVFTVDTSSLAVRSNAPIKTVKPNAANFPATSLTKKTLTMRSNGIHPAAGGSSANANQLWVKEGSWTPNNNWVVAYGLFSGDSGTQVADKDMMQGGPSGEFGGVLWTLDPNGLIQNLSPGNDPNEPATSGVFTVQGTNAASELLGYLADHHYENFYFFGHGNRSIFGSYNGYGLSQEQIADALLNIPLNYQIQHAALHPYRFVMLDGCETGAGTMSQAFGIPSMTVNINFFAAAGVESRAFVGFKSWKVDTITQFNWENYSQMTGNFLADWTARGYNLLTCVSNAVQNVYQDAAKMDSSVIIYGAADMNVNTHTGQ